MAVSKTPDHHPSDALLLDYVSGAASEPMALLVAAHLDLCPKCAERVDMLQALGGAMLERSKPNELETSGDGETGLAALLQSLDDAQDEIPTPEPAPVLEGITLPGVLAGYVAVERQPFWSGSGAIQEAPVASLGEAKARLLKIRAGKGVPRHTHQGLECTLVLSGAFTDESGRFGPGDVAELDAEDTHRPVADPGEDCICLVVSDAPLKFTGPVGLLLNSLVKF